MNSSRLRKRRARKKSRGVTGSGPRSFTFASGAGMKRLRNSTVRGPKTVRPTSRSSGICGSSSRSVSGWRRPSPRRSRNRSSGFETNRISRRLARADHAIAPDARRRSALGRTHRALDGAGARSATGGHRAAPSPRRGPGSILACNAVSSRPRIYVKSAPMNRAPGNCSASSSNRLTFFRWKRRALFAAATIR